MAKKKWKINEIKCCEYLNKVFATDLIHFDHRGGSDSRVPDIAVLKKDQIAGYIEVKMDKAQCGQFVAIPIKEQRIFEYSEGNRSSEPSNESRALIELMEKDFDRYCRPSSAAIRLEMDKTLFYNWIVEYYKLKHVEYFITSCGSRFIVFPIRNFDKYFDVVGEYRKKRSGSNNPALRDYDKIKSFFQGDCSAGVQFKVVNKKFFVRFDGGINKAIVSIAQKRYQLAKQDDGFFRVTHLSNTNRPNVIFEIHLKKRFQEQSDLDDFRHFLGML